MTTRFSVLGSPIEHSLSPALHHAAYRYLGLDFSYEKMEIQAGALRHFVDSCNFSGLSITMPLKQEAFILAKTHDEESTRTFASNTLIKTHSGWSAYNTDVFGISKALAGLSGVKKVVVFGSGATARSGLVALSRLAPKSEVVVVSRNAEAADQLAAFAGEQNLPASVEPGSSETLLSADLVMSLVPSGSFAQMWDELRVSGKPPSGVLFDVAYNPWPSNAALAWGNANVVSGIEMLIWQAIRQIELFVLATGVSAEIDQHALYAVMKDAVSSK
jgi:shikimate dehydrogenase